MTAFHNLLRLLGGDISANYPSTPPVLRVTAEQWKRDSHGRALQEMEVQILWKRSWP